MSSGERQFSEYPKVGYCRKLVEFMVVLRGTARPIVSGKVLSPLRAPCIWVHGPESVHVWTDDPGKTSDILVFHFQEVRPVLLRVLSDRGRIARMLTGHEVRTLQKMYSTLLPFAQHINGLSLPMMDKIQAELTLLALDGIPLNQLTCVDGQAEMKVNQALAWYREHLREKPSQQEVAAAVFVSPAHLRHLFQRVARRSPGQLLREIQMEEAMSCVQAGNMTVSEISDYLGFSEPSAFNRAFYQYHGIRPGQCRKG
ncbi:MAG: helix-turn-helix transcriptional regulator [Kiritimatiellales bacterium]